MIQNEFKVGIHEIYSKMDHTNFNEQVNLRMIRKNLASVIKNTSTSLESDKIVNVPKMDINYLAILDLVQNKQKMKIAN